MGCIYPVYLLAALQGNKIIVFAGKMIGPGA